LPKEKREENMENEKRQSSKIFVLDFFRINACFQLVTENAGVVSVYNTVSGFGENEENYRTIINT